MSKDCVECGQELAVIKVDHPVHYAKYQCLNPACSKQGKNAGWVPKPRDQAKGRRSNRKLLKKFEEHSRGFCEICLRSSAVLSSLEPKLQLEVHHVIPMEDDGTDDPSNLRVYCKECHSEVHRRREAFNRYPGFQQHLQQTEQCQQSPQPSLRLKAMPVDTALHDLSEFLSQGS